jgi:hypothetical protein
MKNIEISFSRHISSSEFPEFANTVDEFKKRYGLCQLSVCHHVSSSPSEARFMAILYEWKFVSLDTQEEETMTAENCSLIWQAKSQVEFLNYNKDLIKSAGYMAKCEVAPTAHIRSRVQFRVEPFHFCSVQNR